MSPMDLTTDFRPIAGWPGYFVRDGGTIASTRRVRGGGLRILKPARDRGGYLFVGLICDGKRYNVYVHKVVMAMFGMPRLSEGDVIRHWDDDKDNNHSSNLIWGSRADNVRDGVRNGSYAGERNGRSRLTWAQVDEMRCSTESHAALARKYGITKEAVSMARRHLTWINRNR
jgi:hypothetical protein